MRAADALGRALGIADQRRVDGKIETAIRAEREVDRRAAPDTGPADLLDPKIGPRPPAGSPPFTTPAGVYPL